MRDQAGHFDNLVFEWQKDLKIYIGMVVLITGYRYFRGRDQETPEAPAPSKGPETPGKLLVQTRRGERLIEIDGSAISKQRANYVEIHVADKRYLVRTTLSEMLSRLPEGRFLRTHRSYAVNVNRIVEFQTADDRPRLLLEGDRIVPVAPLLFGRCSRASRTCPPVDELQSAARIRQ